MTTTARMLFENMTSLFCNHMSIGLWIKFNYYSWIEIVLTVLTWSTQRQTNSVHAGVRLGHGRNENTPLQSAFPRFSMKFENVRRSCLGRRRSCSISQTKCRLESIFDLLLTLNWIPLAYAYRFLQLELTEFLSLWIWKSWNTGSSFAAVMFPVPFSASVGLFLFFLDFEGFVLLTCQDGVLVKQSGYMCNLKKQESLSLHERQLKIVVCGKLTKVTTWSQKPELIQLKCRIFPSCSLELFENCSP